jgi:hypothetical protein
LALGIAGCGEEARVIGTRGSRVLTGPDIRSRLGLRDTWFTFVRVSSAVRRARSARPASWGPRLVNPALAGRYTPAPRKRLAVERRAGDGWRTVARVRTTADGRYRIEIGRAGVYRVRAGRVAGPSVRVR